MSPSSRALLALVASLAACVVSTDDLRPRSAGECAAGEKPCGYRCVSVNDPAAGCGDPTSCAPVDVQQDPNHCGVCNHYCTIGGCQSGLCTAEGIARTAGQLRGIAEKNGAIYWLEAANGGQLLSWAPSMGAFGAVAPATIATNLDPRAGAPSLRRISSSPLHANLHVAGSVAAVAPLAVLAVDPAARLATPVCTDALAPADVAVDGIAATTGRVYFARADHTALDFCTLAGASGTVTTGSSGAIRGLASFGDLVYYGYPDAGGTLARTLETEGAIEQVVETGVGTVPHRVALFEGGDGLEAFWISEVDSDLSYLFPALGTPVVAQQGSGVAGPADVAADSHGVYWLDRGAGQIWEWRHDGQFFVLAHGVAPIALATDVDFVYWTDDTGQVLRVPK